MRRRPLPVERVAALGGIVGPVAFVGAWSVLGAGAAEYSATRDAISRLAANGAPTQAAMTAGLVAFGTGVPLFGAAVRSRLPGPAWALAIATGAATLGVAATPLGSPAGDTAHGALAAVGYATLAALPLAAAGPLAAEGRRAWARFSVLAGVTSAACLLASTLGRRHGLFQRAGLTAADVWVVAYAVELILRDRRPAMSQSPLE